MIVKELGSVLYPGCPLVVNDGAEVYSRCGVRMRRMPSPAEVRFLSYQNDWVMFVWEGITYKTRQENCEPRQ